jgi:hypothetical protein
MDDEEDEDDEDDGDTQVSALGAALMEALKEANRGEK